MIWVFPSENGCKTYPVGQKLKAFRDKLSRLKLIPTETEAHNVISYIRTRLFRFLVLLKKNTQEARQKVYTFVPIQDFNESWTDEKLYKKYELTAEEIAFIESMVRSMELDNP